MNNIILPDANGQLAAYTVQPPREYALLTPEAAAKAPRTFFSAAHVVVDPLANIDPWLDVAIDWGATLKFRNYLYSIGLGVAEAMDTAQRGMGLDWNGARNLIQRSIENANEFGSNALIACGAGTDHLIANDSTTIDDVIAAYEEQCSAVEAAGGRIILMASRALAATAKSPDDYVKVYNRVLSQVTEPVIIHWLGDMFDPALNGYWGTADLDAAMDVSVDIITHNQQKIDGVKISLLSAEKEIAMRNRLPEGVKMYTGDDFNYAELIAGDSHGFSHALLGIFAAIAPAASAALHALSDGDTVLYNQILEPTVPLSRHIFKAPTRFYKTGVVFLAYLNGHQDHFAMLGGQQSTRSALHLAELFRLADQAGVLIDPELATRRMASVMATFGVEQP